MIKRFQYENLDTGWKLEPVEFGPLNLLVGPSGVGKTRILQALLDVQKVAFNGLEGQVSGAWIIDLEHQGRTMTWEARTHIETLLGPADPRVKPDWTRAPRDLNVRFVMEVLTLDGRIVVNRDTENFEYNGGAFPPLDESQSVLSLLGSEEESLRPFRAALRSWVVPYGDFFGVLGGFATIQDASRVLARVGSDLEALRNEVELISFLKLFVLQERHPAIFRELVDDFREIFPMVEEIKLATSSAFDVDPRVDQALKANAIWVGLREAGVKNWVLNPQFSAGMAKTLRLLVEMRLAPPGAVLFLDELENSLGVNCLPQVQQHLLRGEFQVLITSHHPKVINKIPFESWKLVTRHGSVVKVVDAAAIPALQTASPLDKFTQLLNAREYEEAID